MSNRDPNFLKAIHLTQTQVAKALEVTQPTISEGMAKTADFFNGDKLKRIAEYAKRELKGFDHASFDEARLSYLTNPAAFADEVLKLSPDPSQWSIIRQLWSFGNEIEERHSSEFVERLLQGRARNSDLTLVYAVSDQTSATILFNEFSTRLEGVLDAVRVFLFQMPASAYIPLLRLFDAHSEDPKVFGKIHDRSYHRLDGTSVHALKDLFKFQRMGLGPGFVKDASSIISTPELSLVAGPDDFLRGTLSHQSADLRAI